MAINIFAVDEQSEKASKPRADFIGRVRTGMQVGGAPRSLDAFRFTVTAREAAERVAAIYGGEVSEWETKSGETFQVFSDAEEIEIVIPSPRSIKTEMVLWGRNGKKLRVCDGVKQENGSACVCPSSLADRKKAAKEGDGCEPSLFVAFTLAADPEVGTFKFTSGSWQAINDFSTAEEAVKEIDGPARAVLGIERVSWTTKDGEKREFRKPTIKVLGPAEEDF